MIYWPNVLWKFDWEIKISTSIKLFFIVPDFLFQSLQSQRAVHLWFNAHLSLMFWYLVPFCSKIGEKDCKWIWSYVKTSRAKRVKQERFFRLRILFFFSFYPENNDDGEEKKNPLTAQRLFCSSPSRLDLKEKELSMRFFISTRQLGKLRIEREKVLEGQQKSIKVLWKWNYSW